MFQRPINKKLEENLLSEENIHAICDFRTIAKLVLFIKKCI